MKTFIELRTQLDEINFKADAKKLELSRAKISKTDVFIMLKRKVLRKLEYGLNLNQLENQKNLVSLRI